MLPGFAFLTDFEGSPGGVGSDFLSFFCDDGVSRIFARILRGPLVVRGRWHSQTLRW